jgi:DNA-binding response OmpR family regulator
VLSRIASPAHSLDGVDQRLYVWSLPVVNNQTIDDPTVAAASTMSPLSRKILIVDDDVTTARAIQVILREAGYDAATCHAGTAALDAARRDPPDAALIDIHLPDLNGMILAQQLRQLLGPDKPIVMLSGDTSMATLNSLPHVGATYFFSKPLSSSLLVQRLREWLA